MKNLLVTGRPGSGKTTLVESVIQRFAGTAGGFTTSEIREGGVRKGFRIRALDGQAGVLAHVDIASPIRVGKYGVDLRAIESIAVRAVRSAVAGSRIVVIDEIGRMETACEQFRQAVRDALDSSRVVLATIQQRPDPFADSLKSRADTRVFELTEQNRNRVREQVLAFLREEG